MTGLIGKDEALSFVSQAYKASKMPHALLITGDAGIGKKTFAQVVCKMLVCQGEDKPCGECNACQKVDKKIHPDVFEIYPAGKSETIRVEEIEVVKRNIYVKPNDAECKVFMLYEADRMNLYAQNALLKMIEEPPEDSFFIFTCKNAQALLPTVRSRVTAVNLSPATIREVKDYLRSTYPSESEEEVCKASDLSCGNIGLAIELLSKGDRWQIYEDIDAIVEALCDRDKANLCLALGKYSGKKDSAVKLVELLRLVFRDTCAKSSGSETSFSGCGEQVKKLSRYCGGSAALSLMEACDRFLSAVKGNANLALSLTAFEITVSDIVRR